MDGERGDGFVLALEGEQLRVAGVVQDDGRELGEANPAAVLAAKSDQKRLPDVAADLACERAGVAIDLENLLFGGWDKVEHGVISFPC